MTMPGNLSALLVHDLKNALGALEAELGDLALDADTARARRAYRHCSALRRRFVMYLSVYGDGDMQAQPADESPAELLHAAAAAATADLQRQRDSMPADLEAVQAIALRVQAGDAPLFWYFDRRLVRMALDAALHNALRFGRREILLSACEADGGLLLRIEDDGPGVGKGDAPPRNPLPAEDNAATGLGTTLCEAVARAHRHGGRCGHVHLGPRPGAAGARFELWLP